jgi:lysozyme family protein
MAYSYTPQAESEYQRLFDTCLIRPEKYPEIDSYIKKMLQAQARYENVSASTNVPWHVIAIIHCMEGSLSFNAHLHNGDPLAGRTVQVPKGRPKTGAPPFTWEASAEDALSYDGLDKWTDWSVPALLYRLEGFNGYGYHKLGINSPYLWSYSNHYTKGKYVKDGKFSPTTVSKQCGAAVLLRRMFEKQIAAGDTPVTDRTALIENLGAEVNYSPSRYVAKAEELQKLLNLNGAHIRVDGKAGQNTSDAYKAVTGEYLSGDPRI